MTKTICDICGKDAVYGKDGAYEEYVLPVVNEYYIINRGVKITAYEKLEVCNYNLCDKCKATLANTINYMRHEKGKLWKK